MSDRDLETVDVKLTAPKEVVDAVLRGEFTGLSISGRLPRTPEVSVEAVEGVLAELARCRDELPGVNNLSGAVAAREAYALARRVVSMGLLGKEPPDYVETADDLRRLILETEADLAALAALGRDRDDFELIKRKNRLELLRQRLVKIG